MSKKGKLFRKLPDFEYLEHTADAYIASYGETLEEAFENAGKALFNLMTDISKIQPIQEDIVKVSGYDEYALLYNWLEELLVKFETTNILYSRFKVYYIVKTHDGFKLKAKIRGESFSPLKHLQKVGVKAATYHRMEILRKLGKVTVKFILDI
jgi:SHS2 domain-containing protein